MLRNFNLTAEKIENQQKFILWANKTMIDVGMTQKELADKLGCGYVYLNSILNLRSGIKGSKWNTAIKEAILEAQETHINNA